MNLIKSEVKTMSSLEFLDIVNQSREGSGEKPHEPRKFLIKIEDELDDLTGKKFRLNNNQSKTYYYNLTMDQCMLVGMRESKLVRRAVLEKLKELEAPQVPQTYAAALLEAGRLALENEQLQLEAKENAPKVEFFEQVTGSKDTVDMAQAAKVLNMGIGRNKLFELLRNKKVLQSNNQPYQSYIDRGYFRMVESKFQRPTGDTHINIKTVVYQKGLDYIRKLIKSQ